MRNNRNAGIPPNLGQMFQVRSISYIVIDDPCKLIPENLPFPMNPEAIIGMIPPNIYTDNWIFRVLIRGGCDCLLTIDRSEKQFPRWNATSYSGQHTCKLHKRVCEGEECGKTLCIAGNADGFRFKAYDITAWLCSDCYTLWKKHYKWERFWRNFWRSFLK